MVDLVQNIYNNGSYVRIAENQMTAWLFLARAEKPYTKEDVYTYLHDNGVTMGFHTSNLSGMIKKHVYEREIKVALGKSNDNGTDGYFEYTFTPENFKEPKVLEDGGVDYTNMSVLQLVKEGEELAIYHPAVPAKNGYTVTGKVLNAIAAKELPQIPGQGVFIDPKTGVFKAEIEGKVEVLNDRVDVRSTHVVRENVDLIIGKIEFNGDVVVWGNVEAGVVINAARNIEVHGMVEAADLTAGGDIILSGGIQGGQKAKLTAKGNIFADFIEHTIVDAEGDVMANSIINCNIKAKKKVIITGKKGSLIGGYTHGLQGIEATSIGNEAEMKTVVHAGCLAEDQKKYLILKKAEQDMRKELSDVEEELTTLQKNKQISKTVNSQLEKRIAQISQERENCHKQLMTIRRNKAIMNVLMEWGKTAKITVDGNIYRGTIVGIGSLLAEVEHNTCYMRYFVIGGKMESNVIIR